MFGATTITKANDKETYVYSGYGIAFDGNGFWSFGNDEARNVVIFGVDTSSSSHIDNSNILIAFFSYVYELLLVLMKAFWHQKRN